ncbi:MAG: MlaD family protein [Nitrospinota bacterium]
MHYVHRLTPRQKKSLLTLFVVTPLIFFSLLSYLWMKNRGMFIESFNIRTVVSSAQGVKPETPVTFSGIKIGWVTDLVLNDEDAIEVTMKIDERYHNRIRSDSVITMSALGLIGKTELMIGGGSKDAPMAANGEMLESVETLEVESLMDRITPLVNAGEKALLKLEKVISSFPEKKFNSAIEDLSEITLTIKEGRSTAGHLISTDDGDFYRKADRMVTRLTELSEQLKQATLELPSVVKKTGVVLDNAKEISESAKDVGRDLPEIRKKVTVVLERMDSVLTEILEMTPSMKRNVESVTVAADELSETVVPKIPQLLDDVEETLNETLLLLESIRSSWPVKNMVPPESDKPGVDPTLRETPYPHVSSP